MTPVYVSLTMNDPETSTEISIDHSILARRLPPTYPVPTDSFDTSISKPDFEQPTPPIAMIENGTHSFSAHTVASDISLAQRPSEPNNAQLPDPWSLSNSPDPDTTEEDECGPCEKIVAAICVGPFVMFFVAIGIIYLIDTI